MIKYLKKEDGSVAIIVALAFVALTAFSAIVIDYGIIAGEKRSLQNALDAASLAAAQKLPGDTASALQLAEDYARANGVSGDVNVVFSDSNKKVTVSATQTVDYCFAKIFTANESTTVSAVSSAIVTSAFGAYDYALFSGSNINLLQFTGKRNVVYGDVHSNYNMKNEVTINGTATAVGTIDAKISATQKLPYSRYLSMPDFSGVLKTATVLGYQDLINAGASYKSGHNLYTISDDNLNSLLTRASIIYIDGSLDIKVNSRITITGCIITSGDITFEGSNVSMDCNTYISLCSLNGNITFDGEGGSINSMIYAPNGQVNFEGTNVTVNGSVIADVINSNGGKFTVTYDSDVHNSLPYTKIRLVE